MGGIFSSSNSPPTSLVVNFNAQPPNDPEMKIMYDEICSLQIRIKDALSKLENYSGCEELIRLAMSKPSDNATQISAFEGMFPNVQRIKEFYQLGKDIDELIGKLVRIFVESESLSENAALLNKFAEIMAFALTFDRCKMMRPAVQNDFSFYRRALGKNSRHKGIPVNDIEANNISMFIAQATPIISSIVITMDNLQRQIQVTNFLADFAHVCCAAVMREKVRDPNVSRTLFTAMVVAIVIYDQIAPSGVFASNSSIQVKNCISQLKLLPSEDRGALFDALQYSTKTYNKAPDGVKKMIVSR